MKRQEKYPETRTFHFYNANPKNRITGDCVTRALCTALDIPYNRCVMEQAEVQCKTGYDNATAQGIDYYLKEQGWVKMPQPRKADGTKYTGKEWCEQLQEDIVWAMNGELLTRIVANIGGHHTVAIIDGKVYDHWDSTDGCIGNYWIKSVTIG
jgi:hypothetical protein